MIDQETRVVELRGKSYQIISQPFDAEIDTEDLLQVDYNNIIGDIITFPVLFNRISLLKAEIESIEAEVSLDTHIYVAQLTEECRKDFVKKGVKTSLQLIENTVMMTAEYRVKKMFLIDVKRQSKIIDGLYWAAKEKAKKLDVISAKLRPEEFEMELVDAVLNTVKIRQFESAFKPHRK